MFHFFANKNASCGRQLQYCFANVNSDIAYKIFNTHTIYYVHTLQFNYCRPQYHCNMMSISDNIGTQYGIILHSLDGTIYFID